MSTPVTLTADQIAVIRLNIGDVCVKFTDEQIQIAYNAAGGDDCGTNAILARWNWMAAKTSFINLTQNQPGYVSSKAVDIYENRMKYWEVCAGTGAITLSTGSLNLDIDSDWANLESQILHELAQLMQGGF